MLDLAATYQRAADQMAPQPPPPHTQKAAEHPRRPRAFSVLLLALP
jgi:hypothetical protein